ncbi:cell division protein ZipA [Halomonas getboli]|uniref:cell division protein ZipA n=1 Tax=Halomonas getboli TaxID=2935862 RepID=UPI001FFFFD4A|nr:cell division protein ZipA [Halomonas getboli]MCK2184637.1 cell division protein ZipA [Halomonas getboli]
MELREWLIILGLALVTLIVIDGVRRLQRQRRVPRLDQAGHDASDLEGGNERDPDEVAREAELNWELPNGGARVVRPAEEQGVKPKPKLERQDHPGPSRVLSEFRRQQGEASPPDPTEAVSASARRPEPAASAEPERREPSLGDADRQEAAAEPLVADPADHDGYYDEEDYRLVDLEGMGDSLKSGSKKVGSSVQRFGASLQKGIAERRDQKKARREQEKAEKAEKAEQARREQAARQQQEAEEAARRQREAEALEAERRQATAAEDDDPLFAPRREASMAEAGAEEAPRDDVVRAHPVLEKALRHDVQDAHARDALGDAEELIVISVMARDEAGFAGSTLLELMMACGLRYGRDMNIFHRFETEEPGSALQFSMVNVVKPGTFPLEAMDEFSTPGVTLLMPLPSATDTSAAFEAMVETAMVIVRHLGGELKDENMSVMTAQTVEFARQRVQEFERRHRLHRQVN